MATARLSNRKTPASGAPRGRERSGAASQLTLGEARPSRIGCPHPPRESERLSRGSARPGFFRRALSLRCKSCRGRTGLRSPPATIPSWHEVPGSWRRARRDPVGVAWMESYWSGGVEATDYDTAVETTPDYKYLSAVMCRGHSRERYPETTPSARIQFGRAAKCRVMGRKPCSRGMRMTGEGTTQRAAGVHEPRAGQGEGQVSYRVISGRHPLHVQGMAADHNPGSDCHCRWRDS